jgi:membrane protease YdiL (CAAX protease family)
VSSDQDSVLSDSRPAPGIRFLCLLVVLYMLADFLVVIAAQGHFSAAPYAARLFVGATELTLVSLVALYFYPDILALSRWRLTTDDVVTSIAGVLLLRLILAVVVRDFLVLGFWAIICSILINPIAEEIFFRSILLRSLLVRFPQNRVLPIFTVGLFGACLHSSFLAALISQLAFSILYVVRKNSTSSTILCHCIDNVTIAILAHWSPEHHHSFV